jgi:hypothetical protein
MRSSSGGSSGDNDDDDDDDDDMDESEHTIDRNREENALMESKKEQKGQPQSSSPKVTVAPSDEKKRKFVGEPKKSSKEGGESRTTTREETTISSASQKRRKMWSNLLARRPWTKDPRNLSSWLNEVLTVSDMEFPIEQYDIEPASRASFYSLAVAGNGMFPPMRENNLVAVGNNEKNSFKPAISRGDVTMSQTTIKAKRKAKSDVTVLTKVVRKIKAKKSLGVSKPKSEGKESDVTPNVLVAKGSKAKEGKILPASKKMDAKSKEGTKAPPVKLGQTIASNKVPSQTEPDDGFAGSFADWRDRKKGKAIKKGPTSLRK